MIPVFIIDPDAEARRTLRQQLASSDELHCVGQAATIEQAHAALEALDVALVLCEVGEPAKLRGLLALRRHGVPVLVYSALDELAHAEQVLELGAAGFLARTDDVEMLGEVVRSVVAGDTYLSPRVTHQLLAEMARDELEIDREACGLTELEHEVFALLGRRLDATQIALELSTSRGQIDEVIARLRDKVGAGDTFELRCRACRTPDCMLPVGVDAAERAGVADHVEGYGPCMHRFDEC